MMWECGDILADNETIALDINLYYGLFVMKNGNKILSDIRRGYYRDIKPKFMRVNVGNKR